MTGFRTHAPQFDQSLSDPISCARILCIFFVIYVHVNPGMAAFDPITHGVRPFDWARLEIVNVFGRASIALLSVISGYLAFHSFKKNRFDRFLRKRARSLLLPLAIWSAAFIALVLLGDHILEGYAAKTLGGDVSLQRLPTLLLGAFGPPANLPLYFLRDIFICSLFAPLLINALERSPDRFFGWVAVLYLLGHQSLLFLTPNLALFYAFGLYFATRGKVPQISNLSAGLGFALMLLIGVLVSRLEIAELRTGINNGTEIEFWLTVVRFPAAMVFWWISLKVARMDGVKTIIALSPFTFFAFCAHMLILTAMWVVWQKQFGGYYDPLYPVFFYIAPFAVFVTAICGAILLNALIPNLFVLLNGGRNLPATARSKTVSPDTRPAITGTYRLQNPPVRA